MWGLVLDRVDDQLADFHVALATAEIVRVVTVGHLGHEIHVREVITHEAGGHRESLEANAEGELGEAHRGQPLGDTELARVGDAAESELRGVDALQKAALAGVVGDLPDVVEQPGRGELDVALPALALEEALRA